MGLADYLAKNYLSADTPKGGKKRKRKNAETAGLSIADDDLSGWSKSNKSGRDDDDDGPLVMPSGHTVSNRKTTWKTFGAAAPTHTDQAAADAIIASAAAERETRAQDDDDQPAIVGDVEDDMDMGGPQMANGAMAGLQTAEQVTAALKKRERDERKAMEAAGLDPTGKSQETIYRDASGRRIDVAMKRAELRQKADEEARKKAEELENSRGDVQKKEKEARQRQLDDAKYLKVSRYADDEELNAEMKDRGRWNDPAAQFLSSTTTTTSKAGKSVKGRKTYLGASEPNRYGIAPGYRWDGVDRSNGFERKWFAARNAKANIKDLEYAWQMDE